MSLVACKMSHFTLYDWLRSPVDVRKEVGPQLVVFCLVVELAQGVCCLGGFSLLVYVHTV